MDMPHEIVNIINADRLLNAESYECPYVTMNHQSLNPGHYLVLWPRFVDKVKYDETAWYFGPFTSRCEADNYYSCNVTTKVAVIN